MQVNAMGAQALDMKQPTQEQYKRLYAFALDVFDLALWEDLTESQVLAVERRNGETVFVSVMGMLGQHHAVAVYPTFEVLQRIRYLNDCSELVARDMFLDAFQLQLVFGSKSDLFPGERKALTASGIKFKNGKWPLTQSFVPGYRWTEARAGEVELLCEVLEHLLDVYEEGIEIPEIGDDNTPVLTCSMVDGQRKLEMRTYACAFDLPDVVWPEVKIRAVKALPRNQQTFDVDCFPLFMPFKSDDGTCLVHPHQLLVMDAKTQFISAPRFVMPEPGFAYSPMQALHELMAVFLENGYRPQAIRMSDEKDNEWFDELCKRIDVELIEDTCEEILDARMQMEMMMQR